MCIMHVHRQSIHISLYTMYTTVCVYIYIIYTYIYIYMHSWIHSDKIINNGPGWQVPRQVGGKPSLNPGTKWCDLRPRNDDKPLDLDGKCCGGWCTFVTPGHTPRWVQTVPQLWDSTRPRTCISALSFLTLLRPGLIHGRARERALDPNLTSFRNYEPRKSLQFAHEAFQSNGAHFGTLSHIQLPTDQSSCTFYHLNMVRHGPLVPHYCMSISTLSRFSLQMLGHTLHQLRLRGPFSKQRLRSGLCKPGREQSFQAHNVRSNILDSD